MSASPKPPLLTRPQIGKIGHEPCQDSYPRRRELRAAAPHRRRLTGAVPAAVVLIASSWIGAASLAGAADAPKGAPASTSVVVPVTVSALETLESSAARLAMESSGARLLVREGSAEARATVLQASRAGERNELAEAGGANGVRAAAAPESERVGMPLGVGSYRVTSQYGYRVDPLGGGSQFHTGVDLAAPLGTPIHAVADGVVTYVGAGRDGRSSMLVIVKHELEGQVYFTWYNHMYTSGLYVGVGQRVSAGEVIAGVGNNGNSTGPHLHFEVHTDGHLTTTEPLSWLQERDAVDPGALR